MAANAVDRQLTELEAFRYRFGPGEAARVVKLLKRLDATRFPDSSSLIRFHEALLFLRAFPQGPSVVRVTERILNSFHKKVEALLKVGADMDDFDTFEVSGIAGTQMEDALSFDVASWLIKRKRNRLEIAWETYESRRVPLRWSLENSTISRTRNWKPVRSVFYHRIFYHTTPLISRSQV